MPDPEPDTWVRLRPSGPSPNPDGDLARFLKRLGRHYRIRVVEVRTVPPAPPDAPAIVGAKP